MVPMVHLHFLSDLLSRAAHIMAHMTCIYHRYFLRLACRQLTIGGVKKAYSVLVGLGRAGTIQRGGDGIYR
jgi:hypothetical protein